MYGRILVAVDGSDAAAAALREAIGLAHALDGRLRVLYVLNETLVSTDATGEALRQFLDGLRGTGESLLHEAATLARAAGVGVETRLIEAPGAEAGEYIVKEATGWPAELIACGTHGRRGIRRALMGSDAESVVRESPVPVLVVRASAGPGLR